MRLIGLAVILTLSLALASLVAEAQRPPEVRRIGYLQAGVSGLPSSFYEILREGLRDLGYVEGRNIVIEYRSGEDRLRVAELAAELVRLNVEVIVTPGAAMVPHLEQQRRERPAHRSAAASATTRCGNTMPPCAPRKP